MSAERVHTDSVSGDTAHCAFQGTWDINKLTLPIRLQNRAASVFWRGEGGRVREREASEDRMCSRVKAKKGEKEGGEEGRGG